MKKPLKPNRNPLISKKELFAREYIIDFNATAAAARAGYSKKTASAAAGRLLRDVRVSEYIKKFIAERRERVEITADAVVQEIATIAFSNMANYAVWGSDGLKLLDSQNMDEKSQRCVSEVSETITESGGTVKFKLHNKVEALDKLARHLGLYKDRLELSGGITTKPAIDASKLSDSALAELLAAYEPEAK